MGAFSNTFSLVQQATVLNLLTGFEDWYLVTKETHELLKTKETSEQLKVVETPAFLLTSTGEILTTKETHEPLILK